MAGIKEKLNEIKAVEDKLTLNKVARFAYTEEAYETNDANGVSDYDVNRQQNIPAANSDILKVNETILSKGYRSQASSLTRMLVNHFFGRISYNLNKLNDNMSDLLSGLSDSLGKPEGIATLDAEGRIPYSQLPESAMEYKGTWDASTNTPSLADGTGDTGDFYFVSVAGTQNLGSGEITFLEGDRVLYDGTAWQQLKGGSVKSVNEVEPDESGNITLDTFGTIEVTQGNITNIKGDYIYARSFQGSAANFSDVRARKLTSTGDITCQGTLNVTKELNLKGSPIEDLVKGSVKSVNGIEPDETGNITLDTFGTLNVTKELNLKGSPIEDLVKGSVKSVNGIEPDETGNITLDTFGTLNVTNELNLKGSPIEDLIKRAVNSLALRNWTAVSDTKFGTTNINSIAYASSRLIAVGYSGKASYSTNGGIIWTAVSDTKFGTTNINSVCYGSSRWIAVGDSGKASYSTNGGTTWTSIPNTKFGTTNINSIAYSNGRLIAVGDSGKASYSDNGGTTWTAISDMKFGTTNINSIAYSNDRWIAVGDSGKASYSINGGTTWTAISDMKVGTYNIKSVCYGNGRWIAVGESGKASYSDNNGTTWTSLSNITNLKISYEINSITFSNGYWVAAGGSGGVSYSDNNGMTWTSVPETGIDGTLYTVVYARDIFLVAGSIGKAACSLCLTEIT